MQAAVSLNFTSLHEAVALRPWGAHNDYCGKLHSGRLRILNRQPLGYYLMPAKICFPNARQSARLRRS